MACYNYNYKPTSHDPSLIFDPVTITAEGVSCTHYIRGLVLLFRKVAHKVGKWWVQSLTVSCTQDCTQNGVRTNWIERKVRLHVTSESERCSRELMHKGILPILKLLLVVSFMSSSYELFIAVVLHYKLSSFTLSHIYPYLSLSHIAV